MTEENTKKLKHLQWAIESRTRNQQCAVVLLRLFMEHEKQWTTKPWAAAAQHLLAVSFSLWRAAFLANKTANRVEVFADAREFLEKIVEDNSISYNQDKTCREWTFNYYTKNARSSLEFLHKYWAEEVPEYVNQQRTPKERWQYCQELLDVAVKNFEKRALAIRERKDSKRKKRERRVTVKKQRRVVREYTKGER